MLLFKSGGQSFQYKVYDKTSPHSDKILIFPHPKFINHLEDSTTNTVMDNSKGKQFLIILLASNKHIYRQVKSEMLICDQRLLKKSFL